ncbi:MAG: proline--tRNA ligase, partial [Erysipelotrichales bacterium]|nr:proline--tRNA ligase [Erysipelotrichales bacterium]
KDLEGLDVSYKKMYDAYVNCMKRFELDYVIVTADTGVMGGLLSQEFQALSETGEDTIVTCDSCNLSTNLEVAECPDHYEDDLSEYLPMEKVATPNAKTIEEVAAFFGKKPTDFVKTLIYKVDGKPVACLVRGNRDVNETKLRKYFGANEVELADAAMVEETTHARVGFAGPVGLSIPVMADYEVTHMRNFIVGANENDMHLKNVNLKDFRIDHVMDLRLIQDEDRCPVCGGKIVFRKGIEVANPFKLGDKYSKAMNLYYSDANNEKKPVIMGSYGLGIGRTMAAIVEQKHDDWGILWPISVAPYKVAIVPLDTKNEEMMNAANELYDRLNASGIDTLMDDRDERPGVKFKDMDLIGIPMRVTFGKAFKDGKVEFKLRTDAKAELIDANEVEEKIRNILSDYFAKQR